MMQQLYLLPSLAQGLRLSGFLGGLLVRVEGEVYSLHVQTTFAGSAQFAVYCYAKIQWPTFRCTNLDIEPSFQFCLVCLRFMKQAVSDSEFWALCVR
jgi:hypothetical protein